MKLRALRLHGFKSFADRTEIEFHHGITAVVGPNGCGKSNLSDAVRWVLGEQRPTAIRGGKMEEAIFQGTLSRRPVNRGSVSIEVSNEDGGLAVPFSEVEIARTVYRDGGSDYYLNRSACRLRDVQELCRDTGLGANAYAIIENRMIDAILSDRAEERRGLLEEAAGIGKYKDRRTEASRALGRAEVDLRRLEDLIGEVQSRVRSLARQKGKAERYAELRKRRLNIEIALAKGQIEELSARLEEIRTCLRDDLQRDESMRARVETEESRLQTLKVEQLEGERGRAAAARRVDELKSELVRWERELAVAREGAGHAGRRIEQIRIERSAAAQVLEKAEAQASELVARAEDRASRLADIMNRIRVQEAESAEARAALDRARRALEEIDAQERGTTRRIAHLQGEANAAEARHAELQDRVASLATELEEAREALGQIASQGELFADRLEARAQELEAARHRLDASRARVAEARQAVDRARETEVAARERYEALSAKGSALRAMERDREGVGPAIQAMFVDPPDGVLGILADFVTAEPELTKTVEAVLGELLRAVVVRDTQAAVSLAHWFREEWTGAGGLLVLPLDRVPRRRPAGSLLDKLTVRGEGLPWVHALLGGFELDDTEGSAFYERTGTSRVSREGGWVDREGVLHLGDPLGSGGLLERKERLAALEKKAASAKTRVEEAAAMKGKAFDALSALEDALQEACDGLERAEDTYQRARSERTERSDRLSSMERRVREVETERAAADSALVGTAEIAGQARRERESLRVTEEGLRARREAAKADFQRAQDRWEEARGADARLAIERTRLEGDLARVRERESDIVHQQASANARLAELEEERRKLQADQERARALLAEGGDETERLFGVVESVEAELRELDLVRDEMYERLAEAEHRVNEARNAERSALEARHALEMEEQEVRSGLRRIQDRLEAEWGRSLERLSQVADELEADEEELRGELAEVVYAQERIGPVNMLAVEEHEEERTRLAFLTDQRDDLVKAQEDLRSAINEINKTAVELFSKTFEAIRENFRDTFARLFEGGECDLRLREPEHPLESDIEIHAAPRGKRVQRIDLLSGGERALTALSLLFGIYRVKPAPFCVLDEVDAPLDESNISRFIRLLDEFKGRTQFVVITHNPRTIEAADWIYGVTMEEPGVSSIVGIRLDDALDAAS